MTRAHGLLVVRAWTGGLGAPPFAARVWSTPDVGAAEAVMDVVTSPEAVVAAVRRWLGDVVEGTDDTADLTDRPPSG
jgi:hypothetical protein